MSRRSLPAIALVLSAVAVSLAGPDDHHWAWKRPTRPPVPTVRGRQPASPIDAFVRAELDAAGLTPSPPATREHLIRRVTFDLTGLPPTPAEVDAFVNDKSPGAWDKV